MPESTQGSESTQAIVAQGHFAQSSSCSRGRRATRCFLFQSCALVPTARRHMGRNRKWVLQDDIQEAVWRTILRGPRPPSNKWEMRNKSDVSKPHSTSAQEAAGSGQSTVRSEGAETPRATVSRSGHGGSPCQSGQVAGCPYHFGRGRRDAPHNSGSSEAGRIESPGTPSF